MSKPAGRIPIGPEPVRSSAPVTPTTLPDDRKNIANPPELLGSPDAGVPLLKPQ